MTRARRRAALVRRARVPRGAAPAPVGGRPCARSKVQSHSTPLWFFFQPGCSWCHARVALYIEKSAMLSRRRSKGVELTLGVAVKAVARS